MGRSSRTALGHKENIEKERLRHRSGGYFRYEDVRNPIDVAQGCPSHMHGKARMTAGPACEEKNHMEREIKKVARDDITEVRRARGYNMIRYRSKVREASIAMRNHLGFNPIIGEQTHQMSLPPPPKPPLLALA